VASGWRDINRLHLCADPPHAPVAGTGARILERLAGLELSTATINPCIYEAGRAGERLVEEEIRKTVRNVELLYADETDCKEDGRLLWLWVCSPAPPRRC
jgi:hypothetical protein